MGKLEPKVDVPTAIARLLGPAAIASIFGPHAIIGSLVTTLLTEVIPNRRFDRLRALFEELNARVGALSEEPVDTAALDEDRINLFEDAAMYAARASSRERIAQIANVLANGLTAADARIEERRYLLQQLAELNDVEVLLLVSRGKSGESGTDFWTRHQRVLQIDAAYGDPLETHERAAFRSNYEAHLVRLGLLDERFHPPKKLEFDQHGKPKGLYNQLSLLGRMLLREIGEPADDE